MWKIKKAEQTSRESNVHDWTVDWARECLADGRCLIFCLHCCLSNSRIVPACLVHDVEEKREGFNPKSKPHRITINFETKHCCGLLGVACRRWWHFQTNFRPLVKGFPQWCRFQGLRLVGVWRGGLKWVFWKLSQEKISHIGKMSLKIWQSRKYLRPKFSCGIFFDRTFSCWPVQNHLSQTFHFTWHKAQTLPLNFKHTKSKTKQSSSHSKPFHSRETSLIEFQCSWSHLRAGIFAEMQPNCVDDPSPVSSFHMIMSPDVVATWVCLLCCRHEGNQQRKLAFCSNREFMGDVLQETSAGLFCANIPRIYIAPATLLRDCSRDVYKVAQSAVVLALVHQQCGELRYLHVSHNAILNYDYLHSRSVCWL